MRVHDNAFRFPVGDAKNDIGGFATTAGELREFGQGGRYLAGMAFHERLTTIANGFGFVPEKSGGADQRFQFVRYRRSKIGGSPVAGKKRRCDLVDAFIGALRAENDGDEELQRTAMLQRAFGVRIRGAEPGDNFSGTG